jgi:hypothetical protein
MHHAEVWMTEALRFRLTPKCQKEDQESIFCLFDA